MSNEVDGHALAQALHAEAFGKPRQPRSEAYKLGCLHALMRRVAGMKTSCPFRPGTAEFDAYYAGNDEGLAIWRNYQEETHGGR